MPVGIYVLGSKRGVRCRKCSGVFQNRRLLYIHQMKEHYQRGGEEDLQVPPWRDGFAPWQSDNGETVLPELQEVYEANAPIILNNHSQGDVTSLYNFPINNDITVDDMLEHVTEIFDSTNTSFRLNIAFGIILQHVETEQFRYVKPYHNATCFDMPLMVARRVDLMEIRRELESLELN